MGPGERGAGGGIAGQTGDKKAVMYEVDTHIDTHHSHSEMAHRDTISYPVSSITISRHASCLTQTLIRVPRAIRSLSRCASVSSILVWSAPISG
jgi:hypothetical protein